MKCVVVTALALWLCLFVTTTRSAGKKQKCYKVYNNRRNSCRKPLPGRFTAEDCCSNGGSAYGYKRRSRRKCIPCNKGAPPKVHGGWSNWGNWTKCSASCDKGQQLRIRSCTNPKPQNGGKNCTGSTEDKRACINLPHCPIHGNWGSWSPWSPCSVTCNTGWQQRTKKCDNPAPKYNGRTCNPNDAIRKQNCDTSTKCMDSDSASGLASDSESGLASGSDPDSASGTDLGSEALSGDGNDEDDDSGHSKNNSLQPEPGDSTFAYSKTSKSDFVFEADRSKKKRQNT